LAASVFKTKTGLPTAVENGSFLTDFVKQVSFRRRFSNPSHFWQVACFKTVDMTLIQREFSLLLALVGAGMGVVYHSSLHTGMALGGGIGAGLGLIAANLIALLVVIGFDLVTDKPCPQPTLLHEE
jgi:hypothetical protein